MPAKAGISFLLQLQDDVQIITLGDNVAGHTFRLTYGSDTTTDLAGNASAAAVQAAIRVAFIVGAPTSPVSSWVVSGNNGGPYTVTLRGALSGNVGQGPLVGSSNLVGGQTVAVTRSGAPVSYTTIAGGRGARLHRGVSDADTTSKDSAAWAEDLPVIRNWSIEGEGLMLEDDDGRTALEWAYQYFFYLNSGVGPLHVAALTPAGTRYRGAGSLIGLPLSAPHDNVITGPFTLKGTGPLTKV